MNKIDISSPDVFTIEIIKSALTAIGDEMFLTQRRTSMSPIIYESLDYGVGITDGSGRLIAQGNGIPGFIGTLDAAVLSVIEKFSGTNNIRPGDIFVTNDPYGGGGTHLSDVTLIKPVFHGTDIVAWTANKAHWTEVGGKDPGSFSPDSTDVYQEGLQFPCIKIFEADKPIASLMDLIAANVRLPDMTVGDIWAGVASLNVGARRFLGLLDKYGKATVEQAIDALLDHSAAMIGEKFQALPRGVFEAEDWVDEDGLGNGPFRITVKVTITDDEFITDYTGSDPQAPGPVNNTWCGLVSAVRQVFMSITSPGVLATEGCFRRIRIICPEGTITRARRPAPVSSYYEAMIVATDLVWKALAPHLPDRLPAGQFGSICSTVIDGTLENGEPYLLVEPLAGGWGAGQDKDGENGQFAVGNGETANIPVEITETRYGVLVEQYAFHQSTGGAGKFRGGRGVRLDYRILSDRAWLSTMFARGQTAPWAIAGGALGSCNFTTVRRADGSETAPFSKVGRLPLMKGDVVQLVTGAGGGWGDPEERAPERIKADIKDGYLTEDDAAALYGYRLD
ncbi:hydantoinase B/oxoprolinase family protein [Govanella unica]|uniref:Hydantoinase B/oxoprolinase family protein n=1 Tax=Govanella unica TaxID=2975056 RepID=A0A9X3TYF0_9PROT|nr:hydantoinase B/oxoprolinase family protein [Govania unica]MDA5193977.1 hydantoinase B/oxoprolinase family protein [Govania unica]